MKKYFQIFSKVLLSLIIVAQSCNTDDPKKEDAPELITKATLTFTPADGGNPVTVSASDPDGEGVQDLAAEGSIALAAGKTYELSITMINELAAVGEDGYDITEEVEEEGAEHLFLFSWSNNIFSSPTGNGNIDNRSDEVNYTDTDSKNLPIGLNTSWTTPQTGGVSGSFRVVLKHQPGIKTQTSGINIGETDMDITFTANIQ
jgi:hypothetical protein